MKHEIKKIIESYIRLIDDNEFDEFFQILQERYVTSTINEVAIALEQAGIRAIPHMTYIPEGYYMLNFTIADFTTPANIKVVGFKAFYGSDIETVHITSNVTDIIDSAFEACDLLETVVIDDNVKYIGDSCFYGCESLTSVTMPRSVTTLGIHVFGECPKLIDITYTGTMNEWHKIKHADNILSQSDVKKIRCTDGVIEN